jgi:hypothetical protein
MSGTQFSTLNSAGINDPNDTSIKKCVYNSKSLGSWWSSFDNKIREVFWPLKPMLFFSFLQDVY